MYTFSLHCDPRYFSRPDALQWIEGWLVAATDAASSAGFVHEPCTPVSYIAKPFLTRALFCPACCCTSSTRRPVAGNLTSVRRGWTEGSQSHARADILRAAYGLLRGKWTGQGTARHRRGLVAGDRNQLSRSDDYGTER